MISDRLTVLTSVNRALAGKTFSRGKDGRIKNRSYGNEKYFRVTSVVVDGIAELGCALEQISGNRHAFVVRGEPLPGVDRKHARRLVHPDRKTGEPATLAEVPRHWFLADVDGIACPTAIDPQSDPEGAVEYVIGLLPPELQDAWCWWQFSSSQSVFSDETLSLHLWFWSEAGLTDAELTRWAIAANTAAGRKLIDPAVFRAVQPHYLAVPDFVAPLADPLPRRCGLREGLDEAVSLIIPPPHPKRPAEPGAEGYEPGRGVQAYLDMIGGPAGFRRPIIQAVASYVAIWGSKADCAGLKAEIRKAIDRADPGGRSPDQLERYASDEHLDDIIATIRTYQGDTPGCGFTMPDPPPHLDDVPLNLGESESPEGEADEDEDIGPLPAEFSEEALALQFTALHANDWRYTALWGKWLQWCGDHWRSEETLRTFELARRVCRYNSAQVKKDDKLARAICRSSTVAGVERLARADRRHAMTFDRWNAADWDFGAQARTLELHTGLARSPRREDYMTKLAAAAVDERVATPLWSKFLETVTAGDKDLQAYLRRLAGYCMTGVTIEHVLFFLYGTGGNGKGVFLDTLHGIWGSYAAVASMESFIETRYEQHSTDLAMLDGARLVIAQEVEKGKAWSEAKVNRLTGGDPITARYMRQDFFTYKPKFKLAIAGNHKPSLRSVNEATRRRFHLVPFVVTIAAKDRDKDLFEKLKAEWPGILSWALQGCLEWQKIGLAPPESVTAASDAYFAEQDLINTWIDACCAVDAAYSELSNTLYRSWKKWAEDAGEHPGSNKAFSNSLEESGYKRKHTEHGATFFGVALKPDERAEEDEPQRPWWLEC